MHSGRGKGSSESALTNVSSSSAPSTQEKHRPLAPRRFLGVSGPHDGQTCGRQLACGFQL